MIRLGKHSNGMYPIDLVEAHFVAEKRRQQLYVALLGRHVEGCPSEGSCPFEHLAAIVASSQLQCRFAGTLRVLVLCGKPAIKNVDASSYNHTHRRVCVLPLFSYSVAISQYNRHYFDFKLDLLHQNQRRYLLRQCIQISLGINQRLDHVAVLCPGSCVKSRLLRPLSVQDFLGRNCEFV